MADNISANIERARKQAKNLLKIIQKNPDFKINSLAAAQQMIAQINGFQHWHHLTKSLPSLKNTEIDMLSSIVVEEEKQLYEDNGLWSNNSNVCYSTSKNTPFYYQPYSALQRMWNTAITGSSRIDFTRKLLEKSICIPLPWSKDIPITQIGYYFEAGGREVKQHMQEIMQKIPFNEQDKILYKKIDTDSTFNFFETPLGSALPLNEQKDFLTKWLYEDVFQLNKEYPSKEDIENLISELINRLYSENSRANLKYQSGVSRDIDIIFDLYSKESLPKTWREIALFLAKNGHMNLAKIAHAQSMPCLKDMVHVLNVQLERGNFFKKACVLAKERLLAYIEDNFTLSQRHNNFLDMNDNKYYFFQIDLDNAEKNAKYRQYLYVLMGIHFNMGMLVSTQNLAMNEVFSNYYLLLSNHQKISYKTIYLHEMDINSFGDYKVLIEVMKTAKRMAYHVIFTTESLDNIKDEILLEWITTQVQTGITEYEYEEKGKIINEVIECDENEISFLFSVKRTMHDCQSFLLKTDK